jgi:hypothetical protein
MSVLERIRRKVRDRRHYLSQHAEDEMLDDDLERADVERAILRGRIDKKLTQDPRGTRYRLIGPATDGRGVVVVCRFQETTDLIIITVYAKDSRR